MKTVVILSTDNLGMTVADMLNPREMKLVGMGDTRQETWNVFSDLEKGELKEEIEGMPIMPADLAVALQPDVLVIAATDSEKSHALEYMAIRAGFLNDIVFIRDLHEQFSIRCSVLRRLCRRLTGLGVEGNVAELGCYRGDTSWQLNVLMPDRKLYLFDTFEGFDERDVDMERKLGCSDAQTGLYSGTDKEKLMERMPLPGQVVIRKGWFPETAFDIEDETFCLVCMDVCLYQPTLAGLEFFFPRMGRGGVILLSGCSDTRYRGVAKAVEDLETRYGALLMLPVGDLDGTVMIVHP